MPKDLRGYAVQVVGVLTAAAVATVSLLAAGIVLVLATVLALRLYYDR